MTILFKYCVDVKIVRVSEISIIYIYIYIDDVGNICVSEVAESE